MCVKDARPIPLTNEQRDRLVEALERGSTSIDNLVSSVSDAQYDFGSRTDLSGSRRDVATRIVTYMAGNDQLPRLICNAMGTMSLSDPLRRLAAELGVMYLPPEPPRPQQPLLSPVVGSVVDHIEQVFELLRDHAHRPQVLQSLQVAARPLGQATSGIKRLACYKALHDILHGIPLRFGVIARAIDGLGRDGTVSGLAAEETRVNDGRDVAGSAAEELRAYGRDIRRLADQARLQAVGLVDDYERSREEEWIHELETYGRSLYGAVAGCDIRAASGALEGIRSLQRQQASFINTVLVYIAGTLPLDVLAQGLRSLASAVDAIPHPAAAEHLDRARSNVEALAPQLAATVTAHKDWQQVDRALIAEEVAAAADPVMRDRWRRALDRIIGREPGTDWAKTVGGALAAWREAEMDGDREVTAAAFTRLHEECWKRFFDVDKELLNLCGNLTRITAPLERLQELAR